MGPYMGYVARLHVNNKIRTKIRNLNKNSAFHYTFKCFSLLVTIISYLSLPNFA